MEVGEVVHKVHLENFSNSWFWAMHVVDEVTHVVCGDLDWTRHSQLL